MAVIKPLNTQYKISIVAPETEEELIFTFSQLNYRTKSTISSLITSVSQGQYMLDSTMQIFYNLRYGLKAVEGLSNEDGTPYVLEFNEDKTELTDKCVDELLGTHFSDQLQFAARELSSAVLPSEILHPLTLKPLAGVKVVPSDGSSKK